MSDDAVRTAGLLVGATLSSLTNSLALSFSYLRSRYIMADHEHIMHRLCVIVEERRILTTALL